MKRKASLILICILILFLASCSADSSTESIPSGSTSTVSPLINEVTSEPSTPSPEPSNNHVHVFDEWIMVSNPTEDEPGLMERICLTCDYKETQEIPKLSHIHQYSSTWLNDDNQHWLVCSCGEKDSVANHTFDEWVIVKEATDTTTGIRERACLVCSYKQTEAIPLLSHTHSFEEIWHNDINQHWHECTCGEKDSIANHIYGEWITTKEATESSSGLREHSCAICGYTQSEVIPKLSHIHSFSNNWSYDVNQHWHICSCGTKDSLANHTYGEWITTKEATESSSGLREHSCAICGYTQSEVIPKLSHVHSFSANWSYDSNQHWHICSCGTKDSVANHTYGEWVTTKEATEFSTGLREHSCAICGYTQSELIPQLTHTHSYSVDWIYDENQHWHTCSCGSKGSTANHTYGEWITTLEATESSSGLREHSCAICGYTQSEVLPKLTHTHSFTDNWSYDEYVHWHECSCGEINYIEAHTYGEWIIVQEATEDSNGLREHYCTLCGYIQSEVIPKLAHIHSFSENWLYDESVHWRECSCGAKDYIYGHTYGDWETTIEPTENNTGLKERTCNVCHYSETSIIDKLPPTYSIQYILNGGQNSENNPASIRNVDWVVLSPASKIGAQFIGWYLDENHTQKITLLTDVSSNIVLYAYYKDLSYPIHYHSNGGVNSLENPHSIKYGDRITLKKATKTGYTFNGWFSDENFNTPVTVLEKSTSAIDLYAKYTPKSFGINLDANGGYFNNESNQAESFLSLTVRYDSKYVLPIPSRDDYIFVKWVDPKGTTYSSGIWQNITDVNLTAIWEYIVPPTELAFSLSKDGTYYIVTGLGDCKEKDISIPSIHNGLPVNEIGEKAFEFTDIRSVIIPDSIIKVGNSVFYGCSNLERMILPFIGLPQYSSHYLKDFFRYYDYHTSRWVYDVPLSLKTIILTKNVTSIDNSAFSGCTGLTEIVIPDSVTSIGKYAFEYCNGLTSVKIGNGVTTIGDMAFWGCSGLTEIIIPDSVTSIGNSAFNGCTGLVNVIIGDGVTSFGYAIFKDCKNIESLTLPFIKSPYSVSSSNTYYTSYLGGMFGAPTSGQNRSYVSGKLKTVTLTKATTIGYGAFEGCSSIQKIILPNTITKIGGYAFARCTGLTEIIIPESVTSIDDGAFNDCDGLTEIIIPDSVTNIGMYAFQYCNGLTSVKIGNGVTTIGDMAFWGCSGLTEIIIPDSVTKMDGRGFVGCSNLESITIPFGSIFPLFDNDVPESLKTVIFSSNVTSIDSVRGPSIKEVIIPESVTSIGNNAFQDCTGLTEITIPNSVTSIGNYAFSGCTGLTEIIIPNNVTTIGQYAFWKCSNLVRIIIPNSVTSIGQYAIMDCPNFADIFYLGTVSQWCAIRFTRCWDGSSVGSSSKYNIHYLNN